MVYPERTRHASANRGHRLQSDRQCRFPRCPRDQIQPYVREIKRRAAAYQAAGFIVINGASIDAAPDEVFVPPLDDLPEAWREAASAAPKMSPEADMNSDVSRDDGSVR